MRKLEYVPFIPLSPGGGPKSREIVGVGGRGSPRGACRPWSENHTRLTDRGMVKIDRIPAVVLAMNEPGPRTRGTRDRSSQSRKSRPGGLLSAHDCTK